ncbi:DUF29 family protein [Gloeomargarita sp.]
MRVKDFNQLALEHLIAEIESWGKSEKRVIFSYLMPLCEHFLTLKYWESEREKYSHFKQVCDMRLYLKTLSWKGIQ